MLCACGHRPTDHDRQAGCLISVRNAQGVLDFCTCMAYDVGSPEAEAREASRYFPIALPVGGAGLYRPIGPDEAVSVDIRAAVEVPRCTCAALRAAVRACVVLGVGAAIQGAGCAVHGRQAVIS